MKGKKVPHIAILIETTNAWGRNIIHGIIDYAKEAGPWEVYINASGPESLKHLPKTWNGDGIISRVAHKDLANEIQELALPVVNVADFKIDGFSAPCVRVDDREGTRLAAQHFVERGLKNIAFVGPTQQENPRWYLNAFQDALDKFNLECEVFSVDVEDYKEKLKVWLKKLPKPTGVLVWGNGHAHYVSRCCQEAKITVPHDIAILSGGYDELLSYAAFPTLSGVVAPGRQIGYKAAKILNDMLKGKSVPHSTTYLAPTKVAEHASTDTVAIEDKNIAKAMRFIKEHAFEQITVSDINKVVPMSRRALERRFLQELDRTIVDEIRRIRVNKARELLSETDLPMQSIAESCGYATYNYLTHVFKKSTGETPREYRQKYQG